jgi:5-methylcytosine-specific restriction endonuclease McrA
MGALLGDIIGIAAFGFLAVAVLSLLMTRTPVTPAFARRSPSTTSIQLRQDPNARFIFDRGFLFRRRCWFVGTCCPPTRVDISLQSELHSEQRSRPVSLVRSGGRVWWCFEGAFYWESGGYSERDVLALIRDRQRRSAQKLDRAHMLLNIDEGKTARPRGRREPIPREVRRAVFERDEGKCTECGSTFDLQYDHVIPVALGGATTVDNLQLLCAVCNREKSADL